MRKSSYVALLFLMLSFIRTTNAQQLLPLDEDAYYEKIQKELVHNHDSTRIDNYLLVSEYWLQKDSIKSKEALFQAQRLAKKDSVFWGRTLFYEAQYYNQQNQKDKAKQTYEAAISASEKSQLPADKKILAATWYNLALNQFGKKGYDYVVDILTNKAIPLASELKDTLITAHYYSQLGLVFMSVGQFDKAEEQHFKALQLLKNIEDEGVIHLHTYFNLVSNYCYKPDSRRAKIYLDKAARILKPYPNSPHYPNYYYQEGMYYTTTTNATKALESLNKGVKLAKKYGQMQILQMLEFRIYNNYLMQRDYIKAKDILENIVGDGLLIREANNKKIVFQQLAIVNEALDDYKTALQWQKQAFVLSDSLQQVNLLEKMNELEIVHTTTEKQRTIDKLNLEKIEAALENREKNFKITILVVTLALLLIISLLVYRNYSKQRRLNRQIQINHHQQLQQIENERRFEASQSILQGEEQERHRIAQDLHDSMGGMLASIRMQLSNDFLSSTEKQHTIVQQLDQAIVEMRRISRNLMPETLKNLGLEITLQELCESMANKNLKVQFEAYNISRHIPFATELALYRITQECISNTLKHAHATMVIVQISQDENRLNLTIEDDGRGFEKNKTTYGLGIKNIENRVNLINGTLDIATSQGEGTTINIECYV